MGSGALINVQSFIQIGSGVQTLMGGIHRHTYGQQRDLISVLYFFQSKKSRLKMSKTAWVLDSHTLKSHYKSQNCKMAVLKWRMILKLCGQSITAKHLNIYEHIPGTDTESVSIAFLLYSIVHPSQQKLGEIIP
jgi:hypothetical protein